MTARPAGEEWSTTITHLTPEEIHRWLTWCILRLSELRAVIEKVQDAESAAYLDLAKARREAALSDDAPKMGRGESGVSKDYRDAWIDRETEAEWLAHRELKLKREAAETVVRLLEQQSIVVMHLNKGMQDESRFPEQGRRWAS